MLNKQIIIWGYPLHSHTQSYIHYGFYKAFKYLDYNVVWTNDPRSVNFANSFIITEREPAKLLPLEPTSTYMINMIGNKPNGYDFATGGPHRYLGRVKRLIDMRQYGHNYWDDNWYSYKIDKQNCPLLSESFYYEYGRDYEKVYFPWATDLLPHEINFEDRFIQRENQIFYLGNIGGGRGTLETCIKAPDHVSNVPSLLQFKKACDENNIKLITNDVWTNPLSFEECKKLVQRSYLAPDFRHQAMIDWGYIPCRVFKNISYGQIGITNSQAVNDFFGNCLVYNPDSYQLFYDALQKKEDYELIKFQMNLVKEHHTYLNRVKGIIKLIEME